MKKTRSKTKLYHDRNTRSKLQFNTNQNFYHYNQPRSLWKQENIIQKEKGLTYQIKVENGNVIRRNKVFLKKRGENRHVQLKLRNNFRCKNERQSEILKSINMKSDTETVTT